MHGPAGTALRSGMMLKNDHRTVSHGQYRTAVTKPAMLSGKCIGTILFLLAAGLMTDGFPAGDAPMNQSLTGDTSITVICDNYPYAPGAVTAWGFACAVRCGACTRVLFDTGGNSTILLANMARLGIEPHDIDCVVLSHIHTDHTGGLAGFLKKNSNVTVYLPHSFPETAADDVRRLGARVHRVSSDPLEIVPGVYTTGVLGGSPGEQALAVRTARGPVVITGCAHPGIISIIRRAAEICGGSVYLVLGGFHLMGASADSVKRIIREMKLLGVERAGPCHCTGSAAIRLFREAFGPGFIRAGAGLRITVPADGN